MSQPLVEVGATDVDKRACDNVQTDVAVKISVFNMLEAVNMP